ncbi:MAG: hypothetical protein ACLU9R_04455 [Faecalibacterium sp.]
MIWNKSKQPADPQQDAAAAPKKAVRQPLPKRTGSGWCRWPSWCWQAAGGC